VPDIPRPAHLNTGSIAIGPNQGQASPPEHCILTLRARCAARLGVVLPWTVVFSRVISPLPQPVYKQNTRSDIVYTIEKYTKKVFVPRGCTNKMYFGTFASTSIFASTALIFSLNLLINNGNFLYFPALAWTLLY
jgi:hypothetical protein